MPTKKAKDETPDETPEVVPVQGAEPTISQSEAEAAEEAEREARAARARKEDRGVTTLGAGRVIGPHGKEYDPNEKVKVQRPIVDPASQQLVGYKEVEVTRAEADAGLPALSPE